MRLATLFSAAGAFLLLVKSALGTSSVSPQDQKVMDFTNIKLDEYDIEAVEPKKDPKTGFLVGGKNSTDLIKGLTQINGKTIAGLEKLMRPGVSSKAGFLGKDEKLLDIMAADNDTVVGRLGLTHHELAKQMHAMGAVWRWQLKNKQLEAPFLYQGRKFKVIGVATRGLQPSPFGDGTASGSNVTVHNLDNGKTLRYGLLVPFMIERYGFYEGKGTPYRVDPRKILETLDFLKKRR